MSEYGRVNYDVTEESCKHGRWVKECIDCMAAEQSMVGLSTKQAKVNSCICAKEPNVDGSYTINVNCKVHGYYGNHSQSSAYSTCQHGVAATRCTECKQIQVVRNLEIAIASHTDESNAAYNPCLEVNLEKNIKCQLGIDETNPPPYYRNRTGDVYSHLINLYGYETWKQHALMEVIQYIARCDKKGSFIADINKAIVILQRVLVEYDKRSNPTSKG